MDKTAEETLLDILAPASFLIRPTFLRIADYFVKTMFVYTYPRYLYTNFMAPVINYDVMMDISMFISPLPTKEMMSKLTKKVGEFESTRTIEQEKGKVRDPELETAIADTEALRDVLTTGEARIFQYGMYFTIYAKTQEELNTYTKQLESMLGGLFYTRPAILQMEEGFNSSLPLGNDQLKIWRNLDTGSLSTTFPFISATLTKDEGIMYGINMPNNSLIIFDRFSLENANMTVFGTSGGGKSVAKDEPVLIKDKDGIHLTKIGPLVEKIIHRHGATKIDKEMEGTILPNLSVYSFGQNLKGRWSQVTVAAHKQAPKILYKFTTQSGRKITTTSDHNMLILKNGGVKAEKSENIKKGNYVPLPRALPSSGFGCKHLNLLELLKNSSHIYIKDAEGIIRNNYSKFKTACIDPKFDRYLYKYKTGRRIPLDYFLKIIRFLDISTTSPLMRIVSICSKNGPAKKFNLPVLLPLSSSLLRLLGYFVAEGTTTDDYLLISNTDKKILCDIKNCLKDIDVSSYPRKGRGVVIASRVFFEIIKALKLNGKSAQKRIPSFLFDVENEKIAQFLKAYFEGDGGVEQASICAATKSKNLACELSYLLLRFGIIARIKKRTKKATNSGYIGQYYYINISGGQQLKTFAKQISFVSREKQDKLQAICPRKENTNVDLLPGISKTIETVALILGIPLSEISNFWAIKNGRNQVSRQLLETFIRQIEHRLNEFKEMESKINYLNNLPPLEWIIQKGASSRQLNSMLWAKLGHSWQLMKNRTVTPYCQNAFRAIRVISGNNHSLDNVKQILYELYKTLRIQYPNRYIGEFLRSSSKMGSEYETLRAVIKNITIQYRQKIFAIAEIVPKIDLLKKLSSSNLFFDPIVKIQKIKNRDKYVYDLQVDDEVFLCGFGGMFVHNSFAIKLEALRYLMLGTDIIVIDPENEYKTLCDAISGSYINLSLKSDQIINPFDLPPISEGENGDDVLKENIATLKGLVSLLVGGLSPDEDGILERALFETYALKDITKDEKSQQNEPPLLSDLFSVLSNMKGAESITKRLQKYIEGIYSGLFNKQTNVDLKRGFVVFSIQDLDDQLRPIAMYLVMHYIWNKVKAELRRRILIIDEAWWMMQYDDSARFLCSMARRSRKYYLGLTIISQNVEDFLTSKYGRTTVTNCSLQLLLKQSTAAIKLLTDTFSLTKGEKDWLLMCDVGEGLFFAGLNHVVIKVFASPQEYALITSKPEEIIAMKNAAEAEK